MASDYSRYVMASDYSVGIIWRLITLYVFYGV